MHGIGGNTIEDAKANLSYSEFISWIKYRRKNGGFNLSLRNERAIAMLATLYANSHSKERFTVYDFMPYEREQELTLEQAMKEWR